MTGSTVRDRFLIALAKFLGENPIQHNPLANHLVCEEPFLDELLRPILPAGDEVRLDFEKFNQVMLACGRHIATRHFFRYFFSSVKAIGDFEVSVETFRIKAMWLFGNFKFAYKKLAHGDVTETRFVTLIAKTEPRSDSEFTERSPFVDIQTIPEQDLPFLGYISGDRLNDLEMAVNTLDLMLGQWDHREIFLQRLGEDKRQKLDTVLKLEDATLPPLVSAKADRETISHALAVMKPSLLDRRRRQREAQDVGQKNTQRYLTLPHLDVYVATSMREDADFQDQGKFIRDVFGNPAIRDLRLRYFDPTLPFDEDRIQKGLIECLMLRRARVTIYNAGAEDTMGKDSELAATLAQGKPVIVYVQSEQRFVPVPGRTKPVDMDRRAETFRATHPLGLQISTKTGVAHGIIVVRSVEQCATMLRKVLLHDLQFSVRHEGGNFKLEEQETKSILRVVTDDPLLSHSFWAYFRHTEPEADI